MRNSHYWNPDSFGGGARSQPRNHRPSRRLPWVPMMMRSAFSSSAIMSSCSWMSPMVIMISTSVLVPYTSEVSFLSSISAASRCDCSTSLPPSEMSTATPLRWARHAQESLSQTSAARIRPHIGLPRANVTKNRQVSRILLKALMFPPDADRLHGSPGINRAEAQVWKFTSVQDMKFFAAVVLFFTASSRSHQRATRIRESTARQPSPGGKAKTGFRSSSRISEISSTIRDTRSRISSMASTSAGGWPR